MNTYLRWNDAIAAHFFNQDMDGRNVYIYVNQGLVSELEQELESEAGKFLAVVKDGPPWAYSQSICQCALQTYTDWRDRGLHFPPYIAYLGLFVLAGGADGDFSPNAYYPRLGRSLRLSQPDRTQAHEFQCAIAMLGDAGGHRRRCRLPASFVGALAQGSMGVMKIVA